MKHRRIHAASSFSLAGVLMCAAALPAVAGLHSVRVRDPRPFGHFLGSVLVREITLAVDHGDTLNPGSLPRPGPLAYWLDLVRTDIRESMGLFQKTIHLRLVYQVFYAPLEPKKLTLPALHLKVSSASSPRDDEVSTDIPAMDFLASPLREIKPDPQGLGGAGLLRPDPPVAPLAAGPAATGLVLALAGAFLSFTGLLWHYALWPFHRRPSRPFARALIQVKAAFRTAGGNEASAAYLAALEALHRAFDTAAGRRLFADDLGIFFETRPSFVPLAAECARFFAASRRAFYANDLEAARRELPPADLRNLARRLATAERG